MEGWVQAPRGGGQGKPATRFRPPPGGDGEAFGPQTGRTHTAEKTL